MLPFVSLGVLLVLSLSLFSSLLLGDTSSRSATGIHDQETGISSPSPSPSPSPSSSPSPSLDGMGVKISSPTTGSYVPIGEIQQLQLAVSGTSTDNANTDCEVSVIVNNKKPYQPVVANGSGGINDYSQWNFLLNSSYTSINEGPDNKITSKIVCPPDLKKWYSVNVTGTLQATNASDTLDFASQLEPGPIEEAIIPADIDSALINPTLLNITSPSTVQDMPAGSKIIISGTSMDNFYKDCKVYVKKNNLPYQEVTAAGLTGARDYSVWKFTSIDNSSLITPGNTNTLTAKLLCNNNIISSDSASASSLNSNIESTDSTAYATVNVMGFNEAPIAEAKASETETAEGEVITLDGGESTDPNGDSLTYLWKLESGLAEQISNIETDKAVADFKVPDSLIEDTTFEFTLTVTDKYGETATDTVSIEAKANSEPVADAGGNKEATTSEQVTLDGTDSHDPDPNGEIVSYSWEQSDGPAVSLQGSNQPVATFSVPFVGDDTTFEFELTVTDNENAQDTDEVEVEVEVVEPSIDDSFNYSPGSLFS